MLANSLIVNFGENEIVKTWVIFEDGEDKVARGRPKGGQEVGGFSSLYR